MSAYVDIHTTAGTLRGITNAGVTSLLGVRYGESTAGEGRFAPPTPVQPWDGVRSALEFGPSAPQVDTRLGSDGVMSEVLTLLYPRTGSPLEGGPMGEDCLRLNVWSPAGDHAEPLPVLVWLHGGGFTHGSGNEMAFNGDILAAQGDIVVVTVTHRLGVAGFLDLRDEEVGGVAGSANAGMLDIVEALRWVRDNIAQVGGDPSRVTICGQSGGGMKVATLTAMPAAAGLFTGAIIQSGPAMPAATREQSARVRDAFLSKAGVRTLGELRALPLEVLLEAQAELLAQASFSFADPLPTDGFGGPGPAQDDIDLPGAPFTASVVPLMIGWTAHDASFLLAEEDWFTPALSREAVVALLERQSPGHAEELYAHAQAARPSDPPHLLLAGVVSEGFFAASSRGVASGVAAGGGSAYVYRFDQETEVLGGLLGACHSLDLAYVFGTVDRVPLTGHSDSRATVSAAMMRAWSGFARDGRPDAGDGMWDAWDAATASPIHVFGGSAA